MISPFRHIEQVSFPALIAPGGWGPAQDISGIPEIYIERVYGVDHAHKVMQAAREDYDEFFGK